MARTTPAPPAPATPGQTVIASAVQVQKVNSVTASHPKSNKWQDHAWYYYDTIGEFRFAANWVGNLLSRAVLYASRDVGDGPVRVVSGSTADTTLDELFSDQAGRSQMLHDIGVAYTVAGECYVVGYEDTDEEQVFVVASPTDLKKSSGKWKLNGQELPADAIIIRMWRPHPRKRMEADSPARAALPILAEIENLTQRIHAEITSRLTGAGVYWIPNEIAVAATGVQHQDGTITTGLSASAFSKILADTMATAIQDQSDASAMVPTIVTADGEHIPNIRWDQFSTAISEQLLELREAATKRLALSLDMPPEVLTGMGEANHWSAWQVDESAIKSHSEPLLRAITNDLAKGYLRPALNGTDIPDNEIREYGVEADTSEMRLRPNRSKEALELYDRAALSEKTLRRETGFDESDQMSKQERADWLTQKAAQGSTTPEIVAEAMRLLGVKMTNTGVPETIRISEQVPTEERPTPSLEDHPTRDIPEKPAKASVDRALVMCSEMAVFRALERAGNRLRTKSAAKFPDVGASEVYQFVPCTATTADAVLTDAWSSVALFASEFDLDPAALATCLDGYARVLLTEQAPHDRVLLETHLSRLTRPAPILALA